MSGTSAWRDVYLAVGARAISTCGDFLAATALVLAMQERGAGGGAVAGVLIAAALPPVLLARWTGRLADRVDSRLLLIGAGLAQAAVCVALASVGNVAVIVALVAVLGCGLAVTAPVAAALLPAMVTRADLPRASALAQTATSIGLLLAPVLGGVLTGQFGLRVPLLVDAASFLALAAAGLLIRTRRGRPATAGAADRPAFRLRADMLLWSMFVLVGVVLTAVSAVNVAEVFLVRDVLGSSATVYGLLGATWTGAMLAGAWLLTRRGFDDAGLVTVLLVMFAVTSLGVFATGLVPAVGWIFPLFVLGGMANGAENVAAGLLIARRVPDAVHGQAYAAYGAVTGAAVVIGYLVAGLVVGPLPVRWVIAGAGLLGLLATAVLAGPMLRGRRVSRRPVGSSAGATSGPPPA
ncbi:MFS transporter [Actinophytocola sp.]|uniref:MFS transporter n=1 Tax=Actinophytocola sp. TaxID=1872138 RepID=UPI002D7E76AB|nr:MFS transporter [Actinophytocola sp.]HET9142739.1 MFS transporter [Actinophytocola sp.]